MKKSRFYAFAVLSLVLLLSMIPKASFAGSPSSGKFELKESDLLEDGIIGKSFHFVLNSPFTSMKRYESQPLLLKMADDSKIDLYDVLESISSTVLLLADTTPDMLGGIYVQQRIAFIINLYNMLVLRQYIYNCVYKDRKTGDYPLRPSLKMIGTKIHPETVYDEFFFHDPFYTMPVVRLTDGSGNKIFFSLNDIGRGIILFEESYISGLDEQKAKAVLEYHDLVGRFFRDSPELLLLLTCDAPVLTMLRDFPSKEGVTRLEDVVLHFRLAGKVAKFVSDKKRGKIKYETSGNDESLGSNPPYGDNYYAGSNLGILLRDLYLRKKGPIKKLKSMKLPYFYKLYESMLAGDRPASWNRNIGRLSEDERLKAFLKANPHAEYEIGFNTDMKLLLPR